MTALGKIAGRSRFRLRSCLDGNWGSDADSVMSSHSEQIQCSTTDMITRYYKFLKPYLVCFIHSQMLKIIFIWIFIFYDFMISYFLSYLHHVPTYIVQIKIPYIIHGYQHVLLLQVQIHFTKDFNDVEGQDKMAKSLELYSVKESLKLMDQIILDMKITCCPRWCWYCYDFRRSTTDFYSHYWNPVR